MTAAKLLDSKLNQRRKTFITKVEKQISSLDSIYFPTSGKRIVITEGELDAASCYEVMSGWPMVSLPHGAASAKKDLQKAIPFLQGYQEIVLFFDNDEAGRQATELASGILPSGRVKVARLDNYKDASDALQAGDADSIRKPSGTPSHTDQTVS